MSSPYSIDSHPDRQKIIDGIIAGKTYEAVARSVSPPLNKATVWRYAQNVVKPMLAKAAAGSRVLAAADLHLPPANGVTSDQTAIDATRQVLAADPILARLEAITGDRERIKQAAEHKEDFRSWGTLDRNDLAAIELQAKLTGRLAGDAGNRTQVVIVLPERSQAPRVEAGDSGVTIDITPSE